MQQKVNYYLKLLYLPLTALVVIVSMYAVWELFNLPPAQELALQVEGLFDRYGLPILFLSSLVEGMLLVGGYFPGQFVIILGVAISDSPAEAIVTVLVAMAGLYIAHILNYFLGKYGWYRLLTRCGFMSSIENAKGKVMKGEFVSLLSTYFMSSVAAIVDTAAGILQMPVRKFLLYSFVALAFWATLVGTLVYVIGENVVTLVSPGGDGLLSLIAIIAIWAAIIVAIDWFVGRHSQRKETF